MPANCEYAGAQDDRDPQYARERAIEQTLSRLHPDWYITDKTQTAGAQMGYRIKALRKLSGLTQGEVASAMKMSRSYLRKIEHGEANPSINLTAGLLIYLDAAIYTKRQGAMRP